MDVVTQTGGMIPIRYRIQLQLHIATNSEDSRIANHGPITISCHSGLLINQLNDSQDLQVFFFKNLL